MRMKGVCVATGILLLVGCGDDPILKKAAEERAARSAAATGGGGAASPSGVGEPPTIGGAGGAPEHQPGIPEEPTPVNPTDPPPVALGPGTPADPAPVPTGTGAPGDPAPVTPGDPTPGRGADPAPGKPQEPAPAIPGSPPGIPGVAPSPGGGTPGAGAAPTGPITTISGLVAFDGWRGGSVRITAFDGEHAMAQGRQVRVVAEARVDRPGAFTLRVPQSIGALYVEAAVDEDGDGRPGPLDPQGRADPYPIRVRKEPIDGVTITLTRRELKPGEKPGEEP